MSGSFFQKIILWKQLVLRLPAVFRTGGGVKLTAYKAYSIFRNEGVNGLKRRLLHAGARRNDYQRWIRQFDLLTPNSKAVMRAEINATPKQPLISIVMPVYNPKPVWLSEAIDSVLKQIYPHWELCIADDASSDPEIRSILESYARKDTRIKVMFREQNGHIAKASNSALSLAHGDWVALLDHDDILAEQALYWVVKAIGHNEKIQLIYSDEDKINENGLRFDPYFKCAWNRSLFYSHNMISHFGVYRTELLTKVGGFRPGFEGAQDYDLALRCIEQINPGQIYHIPRVLYHWRTHPDSTAQNTDKKPYAMTAGEKALNEHFTRMGVSAKARFEKYSYRVCYALPKSLPLVSLIIPTRNHVELVRQCVESIIAKTSYKNYEILIVDNGSDDPETLGYFESLQRANKARVLRDDRPFNYSALNNAAVKAAQGQIIGLINNDIEVISPEWLLEMVGLAIQPEVGAVGAKLWYPDDHLQHGGVVLGLGGVAGHSHKMFPRKHPGYARRLEVISEYSAVTAACLLVQKIKYEEVGGLNETALQIAFNDVDFCLKLLKAGYRNVWTPYAELYHHESASRGAENTKSKRIRFTQEKEYMKAAWGEYLENDPAYSPNLTLDYEDFSYAWPPRIESIQA